MQKNRIQISPAHKKILVEQSGKSMQAVQMSLDYVFNSEASKQIRQHAKALLIEEANKIND